MTGGLDTSMANVINIGNTKYVKEKSKNSIFNSIVKDRDNFTELNPLIKGATDATAMAVLLKVISFKIDPPMPAELQADIEKLIFSLDDNLALFLEELSASQALTQVIEENKKGNKFPVQAFINFAGSISRGQLFFQIQEQGVEMLESLLALKADGVKSIRTNKQALLLNGPKGTVGVSKIFFSKDISTLTRLYTGKLAQDIKNQEVVIPLLPSEQEIGLINL